MRHLSQSRSFSSPLTPLPPRGAGRRLAQVPRPSRHQRLRREGHHRALAQAGLAPRLARKLGTGYGCPSIQNGKLYIFDRAVEKDALDGKVGYRETKSVRLSCVDARTGKQLWDFAYALPIKITTATTTARAAAPSSTATASTSTAPRGCCTASGPTRGKLRLEGRTPARNSASCRTSSASAARRSSRATC